MRVCGEMALDQIALFQTVKGLKSQSHSCFHGRMAVAAVILPFFVPAAFYRRKRTWKNRKAKRSAGQRPLRLRKRIKSRCSRCRSCTTSPTTHSRCGTTRPCRKRRRASGSTAFSSRPSSVPVRTADMRSWRDTAASTAANWRGFKICPASSARWTTTPPPSSWWTATSNGRISCPLNGRRRIK